MDDRDFVLNIRTPEGVRFAFTLASPLPRLAAWSVDKLVVVTAWSVVSALFSLMGIVSADLARGFAAVAYFLLSFGYGIALEWLWEGQTLGKRLLHLRVMDERGLPLQFSQVVVRNLLRAVDSLPAAYLVGGLTALFTRKLQRLGDIAGATVVVREPPLSGLDLTELTQAKYNSLRGQQHVIARLRAGTSPALAQASLQALVRREYFTPEARLELFKEYAGHFRALTPISAEIEEGISDEQFVRNVVEVLFASPGTPRRGSE